MSTPRLSLTIIGRAAVAFSIAVGGTVLTAAPAMAGAPMAVHGAYGDDPYGEDDPGTENETIYEETTTTSSTTTTTQAPAPVVEEEAPVVDPAVRGAGDPGDPGVAVAPAADTAPQSLDALPRTGAKARSQALFALVMVGLGSVLRIATRKPVRVKA